MSSPPNPELDSSSQLDPLIPPPPQNPPWTGWDILKILILTLVSVFIFLLITAVVVRRLLYPRLPFADVAAYPLVGVFAQCLSYLIVLAFMYLLIANHSDQKFFKALHWNWPKNWSAYLLAGVALSLGLQFFAHFLPMPKSLPVDKFFQTPLQAWVLAIFGVLVAPPMEELFFRGFLYPLLAPRMGIAGAVITTSLGFGLIHVEQLGHAWAPVLVIFVVGLVLTITRALADSLSASLLVHMAYNGTISVMIYVTTDGFRHLERLSQ